MVDFDYRLISLIGENARMSLKDIAYELKKSSQRVKYNLKIIEKGGIIRNPYAIIDYSYFGLILFRVYYKNGYISEGDKTRIINELKENLHIVSIYELTGEYDIAVEFASENPSRFNKELKKVVNIAPTLTDYKIVLNFVTYIYPRNYIPGCEKLNIYETDKILGGDREKEIFTRTQLDIIKSLVLNPKIGYCALAKEVGLNVKTVKKVIFDLEKKKIIRGYKYIIDTNKLNFASNRIFVKLHNLKKEREEELMQFMSRKKEVVQVNKTIGDWDLEIDIESLSPAKNRYIILRFREEFRDLIERFNIIEFSTVYKKSYLPLFSLIV
jgi:DNA-binding Lrp family transcriptional regulator